VNVNNEFIVGVPIEEAWKAARAVDKRRRSGIVNCDFGLAVGLNAIISGVGRYYSTIRKLAKALGVEPTELLPKE
jgi:hypothetical protein